MTLVLSPMLWFSSTSLVPPTINPFSFGEASEGERVQVICTVRRGDSPLTLTWLKDGVPLAQDPPTGLTLRPLDQYSSALLLEHAHAHHSGNYTCQAANAARSASQSATLVIKGKSKTTPRNTILLYSAHIGFNSSH